MRKRIRATAIALLATLAFATSAIAREPGADSWAIDRFDLPPADLPGDRPPEAESKRLAEYRAKAEAGDRKAQSRLGVMYMTGRGVAQDDRHAFDWFHRAALAGDPAAQHYLGLFYLSGTGTEVDMNEATRWLRRCAEINEPETLMSLAWFTLDENRLPHGAVHTAALIRNLAELGTAGAQFTLGAFNRAAEGEEPEAASVVWLRRAAENGHPDAQLQLAAALLELGRGKDAAEAVVWLEQAAEQGSSHAMRNLGVAHYVGRGVERDPSIAFRWFSLAERFGDEMARRDLDHLEAMLGTEAYEAAQRAGQEWLRDRSLPIPQPVRGR